MRFSLAAILKMARNTTFAMEISPETCFMLKSTIKAITKNGFGGSWGCTVTYSTCQYGSIATTQGKIFFLRYFTTSCVISQYCLLFWHSIPLYQKFSPFFTSFISYGSIETTHEKNYFFSVISQNIALFRKHICVISQNIALFCNFS
jgi:hypothetical protein